MTARLPNVGGDDNDWGTILNEFLQVSLNSNGTLNSSAVTNALPARIPATNLGGGTASSSNFLRGDGVWAVPSSSGVTIDTTSADIQPLGVKSAGSTGQAADAGHVHPLPQLDQLTSPTGSVSLSNQKIINLANGTAAHDAAAFGQIPTSAASIGGLLAANNLSDVNNAADALANLGGLPTTGGTIDGAVNITGQLHASEAIASGVVTLTDSSTVSLDASHGNVFEWALGGNNTLGAPTNPTAGQVILIEIQQPASGGPYTPTFASGAGGFAFSTDGQPAWSTATSAVDQIAFRYSSLKSMWLCQGWMLGF